MLPKKNEPKPKVVSTSLLASPLVPPLLALNEKKKTLLDQKRIGGCTQTWITRSNNHSSAGIEEK
jgi:hypothetical protein